MTIKRPAAVEEALQWLDMIIRTKKPFLPSEYAETIFDYIKTLEAAAPMWQDMDSAPKDGTVINVVCRYPDATAGSPSYAAYSEGKWWEYSKYSPQEVIPWAWRPRDEWPQPELKKAPPQGMGPVIRQRREGSVAGN